MSGRDELGLDMGYGGLRATRLFGFHSLHKDPPRVDSPILPSSTLALFPLFLHIYYIYRLGSRLVAEMEFRFVWFIAGSSTGYRAV